MKKIKPRWPGDAWLGPADEVVRDGESVRVPMFLCDGMDGRRSGYLQYTDAQNEMRRSARQGMIDRAQNAWRMDARRKKLPPDDEDEE
jgi:hypothetical protein